MPVAGILVDIEGTTSSFAFVKDVLFPYARGKLCSFVAVHAGDPRVRALLDETRRAAGLSLTTSDADVAALLVQWIDQDRKAAPLKALQGFIWEQGYAEGEFKGHVYADAVTALRLWHGAGLRLFVFSSGSVQAQQQLFRHTDYGDLAPLFSGYFDTRTGPKRESGSYRAIAAAVGMESGSLLFLSDTIEELDAAAAAGLGTVWVDRAGSGAESTHHRVGRLTEVEL